ncbi:5-formyltetrahydrofolate cyclo-ligase [Curvivirga sp.]|uniref:5-formyltetrahydrofolate cyclo-ligase n=1 Tax=Curvivirga sp. TaxID=2856848 RepID=UPI003B590BE2
MSLPLAEVKQAARKAASKIRKEVAAQDDGSASLEIFAQLQEAGLFKDGLVISGFLPIGSEIDTRPILEKCRELGMVISLPCVEAVDAPLTFRKWHPDDELVKESFGTMAPAPSAEEVQPDIILSPMLAFDREGFRLGYGGGFYDRSLEKLRKVKSTVAIGVAYAGQEIDAVPHDHLDQPLDMVVTEKEVIRP